MNIRHRAKQADVPAVDIAAIEKVINVDGYTYGECLDISLWKKLGNGAPTQIVLIVFMLSAAGMLVFMDLKKKKN